MTVKWVNYNIPGNNMLKNEEIIKAIKERTYTYTIVKDREIIYQFSGSGIGAVYKTIKVDASMIKDNSIYDTYVGKAVAMLLIKYGAKAVYGEEMTQAAIDAFMNAGVEYRYSKLVPMIYNHDESAECPFELAVKELEDFDEIEKAVFATMSEILKKQAN